MTVKEMPDIKARITALFIVARMARRELSVKLFDGQTMMTKRGASNYIDAIPLMNKGIA